MPSLAFRITGQYKPTNDAAVRASLRDAFSHGKVDDDVTCPETHRIVAIRGTLDDTHALVGGGVFTVRGRFSTRGDVGGCETNKALRMYLTQTAEESIGGRRAMVGRPTVALAAMPSSVRNPARKRKAAKRRNPASKPRTYAIARADILRALRADGWDVRENLKVPHATHPSGEFRLWFKTQAIYFTTGDRRRGCGSLSDAHSLWIGDIRTMPVAEVLADIERARMQSSGPQRNPSQDNSTDEIVVEYAIQNLFKRMGVEKAARVTAEKLSGKKNLFIGGGGGTVVIDPKRLEWAIWDRLVRHTMKGISWVKPGKEDVAFLGTVDNFRLGKKDQKTLKPLVENAWGRKLPEGT